MKSATPFLDSFASQTAPGVFHARHWGLSWGGELIEELRSLAATSMKQSARLCMHPHPGEAHQEMLIVLTKFHQERPQRRTIGFDTKVVIEGLAELTYFDQHGNELRTEILGGYGAKYLHTNSRDFHRLHVVSEYFVFLEILAGPFDRDTTEIAPWHKSAWVTEGEGL